MASGPLTIEAAQGANLVLVTEPGKGSQAVHDLVVALQANRRTGSACAKTRAEVAWSGKKPFRQKGTGRARQGGNAAPHHRGGGVAFGPRPRDYSKKVSKSTRRLALQRVLGDRIAAGDVSVTPSFEVADGKTKSFIAAVKDLCGEAKKILIVGGRFDDNTFRAGRNYRNALLISADEVNVEQLLGHNKIVLTDEALETLAKRTQK
ncbi:MAG: 50S ribosomal protein L4 [Verrucomicrobiales bacterium]